MHPHMHLSHWRRPYNNINLGSFKVQVNNKRYLNIPSLTWSSVWRQKTFTEDKTAGGFNGHISFLSWLRTPQQKPSHHVIFCIYWLSWFRTHPLYFSTDTHLRRLRLCYLRRQMGNRSDIDPIENLNLYSDNPHFRKIRFAVFKVLYRQYYWTPPSGLKMMTSSSSSPTLWSRLLWNIWSQLIFICL